MSDEDIIQFLWPNKISLLRRYENLDKDISIYKKYLENRFSNSYSIEESLYRIKYNVIEKPKCPTCGKESIFDTHKNKYKKYCDYKCLNNNEEKKNKNIQTLLSRYGVVNISQLNEIKERVKQTCIDKYGVKNPYNLHIDKSIETRKNNKEINKQKETNIEKYGVDNVAKNNEIKNKIKTTCVKKYGKISHMKLDTYRNMFSKLISSKEIQQKINNTKKLNHTFNTSKPENESYKLLKEKYPNVEYQYRSELYPFVCDFFIPELDLYIECNYHWTHGGHPFDSNNINDYNKLELWKSKNTKYYDNAINCWTIRDVNELATH